MAAEEGVRDANLTSYPKALCTQRSAGSAAFLRSAPAGTSVRSSADAARPGATDAVDVVRASELTRTQRCWSVTFVPCW